MTLLVASINVDTLEALKPRVERARAEGAEAVEVRIDGFADDLAALAAFLREKPECIWIITCRSTEEGGRSCGDSMERVSRLIAASEGTNAYLDLELADWRRLDEARQRLLQDAVESGASSRRLILSAHDLGGVPVGVSALIEEMADVPGVSCAKVAYKANHICDTFAALDLMHEHDAEGLFQKVCRTGFPARHMTDRKVGPIAYETPPKDPAPKGENTIPCTISEGRSPPLDEERPGADHIELARPALTAIAMGEEGLWTRVLAGKLNAFATYCTLDAESTTAPGQVTLEEMIARYRWPTIDPSTQVFGVIGDPVAHSMGPLLFNQWFAEAGINAVYLPLRICPEGDGLTRFLEGCRERPWLDVGGFSVTLPHKITALQWVGSRVDSISETIGALNTLVFRSREVTGYNTDCEAAVASLAELLVPHHNDSASKQPRGLILDAAHQGPEPAAQEGLEDSPTGLAGLSIDLLGSGGAARAVLFGLSKMGCKVTIYGRSPEKTRRLAEAYGASPAGWEDRAGRKGQVLINCTSVGMWPQADASPMPPGALRGCRLVFDLIYNPLRTRLLKDAAAAGAKTLSGLDMFIRQAAMQFELWTGKTPDTQRARRILTHEIEQQAGKPR